LMGAKANRDMKFKPKGGITKKRLQRMVEEMPPFAMYPSNTPLMDSLKRRVQTRAKKHG
jgi:hypothetical protein